MLKRLVLLAPVLVLMGCQSEAENTANVVQNAPSQTIGGLTPVAPPTLAPTRAQAAPQKVVNYNGSEIYDFYCSGQSLRVYRTRNGLTKPDYGGVVFEEKQDIVKYVVFETRFGVMVLVETPEGIYMADSEDSAETWKHTALLAPKAHVLAGKYQPSPDPYVTMYIDGTVGTTGSMGGLVEGDKFTMEVTKKRGPDPWIVKGYIKVP